MGNEKCLHLKKFFSTVNVYVILGDTTRSVIMQQRLFWLKFESTRLLSTFSSKFGKTRLHRQSDKHWKSIFVSLCCVFDHTRARDRLALWLEDFPAGMAGLKGMSVHLDGPVTSRRCSCTDLLSFSFSLLTICRISHAQRKFFNDIDLFCCLYPCGSEFCGSMSVCVIWFSCSIITLAFLGCMSCLMIILSCALNR